MTFEEYKSLYGEDGYCSLIELENIREESDPEEYEAILNHWQEAHYKQLERLEGEFK